MANSRKSKAAEAVSDALPGRVAVSIQPIVFKGQTVLLGLSGGVDSMVLLDIAAALSRRLGFKLGALHVNHQLNPRASEWAAHCRAACKARKVPLKVVKVTVPRGNSIEAAARDARHGALFAASADVVLLAHNLDDQVETVLLQLLRGTGMRGLAAMAPVRRSKSATKNPAKKARGSGPAGAPTLARPLLDVPRSEIERYAREQGLTWIEDDSNDDVYFLRNFLRREILPRLAGRVPAYRAAVLRAARHAGEAVQLIDELAALDAGYLVHGDPLPVSSLTPLSPVRAKNLLRYFLSLNAADIPSAERLEEALRQALEAGADANVRVSLGGQSLRRHGGMLYLVPDSAPAAAETIGWRGQVEVGLPGGTLRMSRDRGTGLSLARLKEGPVTIRLRAAGEKLQPDCKRPRRTLKNLLQESRIPPWQREQLPYIYCGKRLVCVPGIGVDCEYQAKRGEPSLLPLWIPRGAGPAGAL